MLTLTPNLNAPLVVNTTPVGMWPNVEDSIWPTGLEMPSGTYIYDLVYNPAETALMKQAKSAGFGTINGVGMLLGQGAEAFRLWTGIDPDYALLESIL